MVVISCCNYERKLTLSLVIIRFHFTIIYKNGWTTKLFNASSPELFKGHINYCATDNDTYFLPTHPYTFAKLLSHNMIDYYRTTYNLPFSNGMIFTTESNKRNSLKLFI